MMPAWLSVALPWALWTLYLGGGLAASVHVLLYKRHIRAAIGWLGVIWLAPWVGASLYLFFGVNRIKRRAIALRASEPTYERHQYLSYAREPDSRISELADLARAVESVTRRPLLDGNAVRMLEGGDQAFSAMLKAIDDAELSIVFATYIFDRGKVADAFTEALAAAKERGVEVRVLIDAVGARYSFPPSYHMLRRRGIRAVRFLPGILTPWLNLRNHRKILVIDGKVGFTGGINVRDEHLLERGDDTTFDTHFELRGPIVAELAACFAADWAFVTKERLEGPAYFPAISPAGSMLARGILDGPDADMANLGWALLAAVACAKRSIKVATPYFLPELELATALDVAAMRGVEVDLIIPRMSNLPLVSWATWGHLRHVLGRGCRVYATPRPFDHSKLMVVDDRWVLLGSANWDSRSLRLNFEFDVEVYDEALAREVSASLAARIERAELVRMEDLHRLPLWIRLRDGLARLFSPYL
jgi:cardiolipin synthase A/B